MTFFFKACPRCTGDLLGTQDIYGKYIRCVQCGHIPYPAVTRMAFRHKESIPGGMGRHNNMGKTK